MQMKRQEKRNSNRKGRQGVWKDDGRPAGRGRWVPSPRAGQSALLGVPQSTRAQLVLTTLGSVTTTAVGGYAEVTSLLNSAYNGGGAFVFNGYAKYMQFFSKCFVLGSRVVVHGNTATLGAGIPMVFGVTVTTNTTSLGSATAAINNGMCSWVTRYANPDSFTVSQAVNVGRFLHKPNVLDDPQLFSTSAADPSQIIVAHYWIQATAATGAAITIHYVGEIVVDCVFTDPIPFT